MAKELHWCTGCERVIHCEKAFRDEAEGCDFYIRSDRFPCCECLRYGGACMSSGLNGCNFLPRKKSPAKLSLLKELE